MKVLSVGWNTFHETGKYTCATVEYAGLLSYSMFKRSGIRVFGGVRKITSPVAATVCWPYEFIRDKTGSIFSNREHGEKIEGLTKQLVEIEKRLAQIEKHGVIRVTEEGAAQMRKRKLREDKVFVLKGILEETKALKTKE
ncbi:MAG TPA: hypothetical protein HPQ03_05500 [Deltaproteobacteria bacterium]|nr:hypothetical protein [Deltaproteobacteria bacterium]